MPKMLWSQVPAGNRDSDTKSLPVQALVSSDMNILSFSNEHIDRNEAFLTFLLFSNKEKKQLIVL